MTHIHAARFLVAAAVWAGGVVAWTLANVDVNQVITVGAGIGGLALVIRLWLQARAEDQRLEKEREAYDKLRDDNHHKDLRIIELESENRVLRSHIHPKDPFS